MKRLATPLVLMLALLVASCANWQEMECPESPFVQQATVTWVRVPDAKAECAKTGWDSTTFAEGGCTQCRTFPVAYIPTPGIPPISQVKPEHRFCTVIMQEPGKADDRIVGHEFKHVFGCRHRIAWQH